MTDEDRITELWNAHCTYDDLGAPSRKDVLEFAEAIRREALEDAAQACEAERIEWQGKRMFSESYAILCAADRVRALKEQP